MWPLHWFSSPLLRRYQRSAGTPEEEEAVAAEWWSGDAGFGAA